MTTTKHDELDGLPEDPPERRPLAGKSSPSEEQLAEWNGPLPANRRRKQDREAGPSEKHVYVPPVTLAPTQGPSAVDQQKIVVAPSVLKPVDHSRNQPTIRKLPMPTAKPEHLTGAASGDAHGPEPTRKVGTPPAAAAARPTTKASSPWSKGGLPAVDREALPSAQLLSSTASGASPAAAAAKPAKRRSYAGLIVVVLLSCAAALSVYVLVQWPEPKVSPSAPIQIAPTQAPAAPEWAPAPLEPTAPRTATPSEPPPAAPPTGATSPDPSDPVPSTASPTNDTPPVIDAPPAAPRPPATARPTGTAPKSPATAKPLPTSEPVTAPPPPPPPTSTTTAPPRPF